MIMKSFEEKCRIVNYELYLLHTISKTIKESLDENRILSVMLTGLTANVALGLSRAAVFYYNAEKALTQLATFPSKNCLILTLLYW